jgi:hypothetical protein
MSSNDLAVGAAQFIMSQSGFIDHTHMSSEDFYNKTAERGKSPRNSRGKSRSKMFTKNSKTNSSVRRTSLFQKNMRKKTSTSIAINGVKRWIT